MDVREALSEADDETELIEAIRQRVATLSGRQLEIQAEIERQQEESQEIAEKLAAVERELVEVVDESVEESVETIDDVDDLPDDVDVTIDPELLARTQAIRDQALTHHQSTRTEGDALLAELERNDRELTTHRDVIDGLQEGDLTVDDARSKLLEANAETETESENGDESA